MLDGKPESWCRHAHLYGGFAHSLECVAARFRWRTFLHEIAKDGCGSKDGEVKIIEGQTSSYRGRMPDSVEERDASHEQVVRCEVRVIDES